MDDTPPRNRLIAFYTLLAVGTLMVMKPAFDSYYDRMYDRAVDDRLEQYNSELIVAEREVLSLSEREAQWETSLSSGAIPIHRAMQQVAQGRTRVPQVAPQAPAEQNMDPLTGWTQLPNEDAPSPAEETPTETEPMEMGVEDGVDPALEPGDGLDTAPEDSVEPEETLAPTEAPAPPPTRRAPPSPPREADPTE
ncbi:MAG: hypothetical protein RLO52_11655 [Sandaracinaceae bacterium]